MAQVDEEGQARETYGDAPGVNFDKMTTAAPTPRPKKDAPAASSPATDAEAAPSAEVVEETPQTQEGEPSPHAQPESVYNVPPKERWDEVIQARREAERQRDDAMRLAQEALQRVQQPSQPQPQASDPWEPLTKHQDPNTAQFWGQVKELMQHERRQAKQEAVQELAPVIQAGMEKLAQFDLRDFRKENPDIKPGSEDERQIVAYMNGQVDGVRHPLESAKRNAMFEKLKSQVQATNNKNATIPQKRQAANAEASAGIPNGAGLPSRQVTGTDRASETLDKGGSVIDAAAAFFGMRR